MTPLPDLLRPSLLLPASRPAVGCVGAPAYPRKVLARLAAGMLCGLPLAVLAQASAWDAPAQLRASPMLGETLPEAVRPQLPVFISGERITGQPDVRAVIEGDAELRRYTIQIERLRRRIASLPT